jgi:hypothetical protein
VPSTPAGWDPDVEPTGALSGRQRGGHTLGLLGERLWSDSLGTQGDPLDARLGEPRVALADARRRAEEQHIVEEGIGDR